MRTRDALLIFAILMAANAAAAHITATLSVNVTASTGMGTCTPSPCPSGSILPPGVWTVGFDEEFPGTSINTTNWYVPPDGSKWSGDLEHCSTILKVNNGTMSMVHAGSPDGYGCDISTNTTYSFGYYEAQVFTGAWPYDWGGFWMNSSGNNGCPGTIDAGFEADIIETYNSGQQNVYYNGYGSCKISWHGAPPFANSDKYHIYGADVEPTGITFYIDGKQSAQDAITLNPSDDLGEYMVLTNLYQVANTNGDPGLFAHWVRFYHH